MNTTAENTSINSSTGTFVKTKMATEWKFCGKTFSKEAMVYISRMIMLYLIAIVSCINLTLGNPAQEIWITFLSISLGGIGVTILRNVLPRGLVKTPSPSINAMPF